MSRETISQIDCDIASFYILVREDRINKMKTLTI